MMMNRIRFVNLLKSEIVFNLRLRRYSSALYITGDKAQNNFVVLTPFIDFDDQIKNNKDKLIENIKARGLDIDLAKIQRQWNFYKMIDDNKSNLELTRSEIYKNITKLKEDAEKNKAEIDKLVLHMKLVKDDLKNIKEYSYSIEEEANLNVLKLPNILHPKTPLRNEFIIHEFKEKPTHESESHLIIAEKHDLIEYTNPLYYFMKNKASLFEFGVTNYLQDALLKSEFIQFSNADFARSIVIEGCGVDYLDKTKIFTLDDPHNEKIHEISKLHLVGGASLYSFMAYFAKHIIPHNVLPLKLFTIGRNYKPANNNKESLGLFNLSQETCVSIFIALSDDDEIVDNILNETVQSVIKIYEKLDQFHFRVIYVPANRIDNAESLRVSIQMFSNHLNEYIEIGNLSVYDNYLSKRLLFTYKQDKEQKFAKIIAGNIMSVQKILGCAIENSCSL